jgi:Ni/Co efflux regulator RcnB
MKRLLTAAMALSLLTGTAALAQPDHRDDRGGRQQGREDRGGDQGQQQPHHNWSRGQRLPSTYYADRSHYVDYRANHLRRPPHGYQWVQADDNFALVALTTGLIASIATSHH